MRVGGVAGYIVDCEKGCSLSFGGCDSPLSMLRFYCFAHKVEPYVESAVFLPLRRAAEISGVGKLLGFTGMEVRKMYADEVGLAIVGAPYDIEKLVQPAFRHVPNARYVYDITQGVAMGYGGFKRILIDPTIAEWNGVLYHWKGRHSLRSLEDIYKWSSRCNAVREG